MAEHVMNYVESDLAVEVTLVQWRRARSAGTRRRRWFR
jgi:hypothetical protein